MKRYGYVNPKSSHLIMDGIFRTLSNFSFVIECILHLSSPLLGAWDEFKRRTGVLAFCLWSGNVARLPLQGMSGQALYKIVIRFYLTNCIKHFIPHLLLVFRRYAMNAQTAIFGVQTIKPSDHLFSHANIQ
jgi:hypothetical protein